MKVLLKVLKIILIIILSFGAIAGIVAVFNVIPIAPSYKNDNSAWFAENGKPRNIPHGGAKELYPENTKYSFDQTAAFGKVFEVDLSMTKDKQLISHHDTDLGSSITAYGQEITTRPKIIDLTFEQVKQKIREYDFKYVKSFVDISGNKPYEGLDVTEEEEFFPTTLDYMFSEYPTHLFILEIKDTKENSGEEAFKDASDELLKLIKDYEMEKNVIVASFDVDVMKYFREKDSSILTATAEKEVFNFLLQSALFVDFFYSPKAGVAILPYEEVISKSSSLYGTLEKVPGFIRNRIATKDGERFVVDLVTKRIIDDFHRHGMAVLFWTVDDAETMKKIIDLGGDGIITDRPDILKEVLAAL